MAAPKYSQQDALLKLSVSENPPQSENSAGGLLEGVDRIEGGDSASWDDSAL
jgi:hypothetical protein